MGTVKDSMQIPLQATNIIAQPQDSLYKIRFAITDDEGSFKLQLDNTRYTVIASHLGYKTFTFEFFAQGDFTKNIVLARSTEGLEEVIIEMPIVVKEDTIIYNIDKFVTGEERKLKDVLKKLPGVEVDRDGTIRVRGKEVTVMLVENKKFFGGGSKLAIDNIPADAVYQIEVLDNYNEVSFLKNLSNSNEMAMNVKLKEDKKNFTFGDLEAGKGNRDFYRTHSNLFYYSPKTNLNFIGNLNNIREQVLTYDQYFDFRSGLNPVFNQGNTDFDLTNNDFSQFIESQDVVESRRQFGALNISQEVNNKLNISAYGIFSKTKEETFVQANNRYNTFTEISKGTSATDNLLGIGHIKAVYLPNLTDQWYFKTQFKKTENALDNLINSVVDTINNTFFTHHDIAGSFFNQSVEWHRKSSMEHTFSFAVNYIYEERAPETIWETSDPILQGLIPVVEQPLYRLNQSKRVRNNQFNGILKHYWVLNKNNHIYSTLGNTYLNQQFFTRDFQKLDDGSINDFSQGSFGNDLDFRLNDLFFGLNYKFQLGIFSFDQGLFLHHYQWNVSQQSVISNDKTVVLPGFSAEAKFSQTKELEFKYKLQTSFSEAPQFANRYYISSYNSVYQGNEYLENGLSHNFNLRYTKFSTYRGFRYYAVVNYIENARGVVNSVNYEGINQSVMPILVDEPEIRWSIYGNISKKISDINFSAGIRYNTSKYKQLVNSILFENKNSSFSYNLSGKSLFENLPIVELGLRQSFGNYTLSGRKSEFVNSDPFLNIDYDFWKGFIFSFDYRVYRYRNKDLNLRNNYEIANASIYYKKENSPWSFEIEVQNLFDVAFKNRNSFSAYIISDTRTYILPRIVMFTVGYNL
ncbi:MAG: carboxypeptidase-like regulatory domain-containing protein [Gillisia sp.]